MKIAVVDDLSNERIEIISIVSSYFSTNHNSIPDFEEFESAEDFLANIKPRKYDLVLMDIYMKNITGISAAEQLRAIDRGCGIIFFTSSREHILEGYGVNATGYVLKPVANNKAALYRALDYFADMLSIDKKGLDFKLEVGNRFVLYKNIMYIESSMRHLYLYFPSESIRILGKFSDYAAHLLKDDRFIQPYRNLILNMDYIDRPMEADFLLKTGVKIPISRRKRTEVIERYTNYLIKRRGY